MNKPTAEMTLNDMVLAISIMKRTRDAILAAYTMQVYDWATKYALPLFAALLSNLNFGD